MNSMTIEQFMEEFAKYVNNKKWKIVKRLGKDLIRSEDGECPVCFLDNQTNDDKSIVNKVYPGITKIAQQLGSPSTYLIVIHADNKSEDPLRMRLLQLCGLQEKI